MRRFWSVIAVIVAVGASGLLAGSVDAAPRSTGWSIQPSPNPAGAISATLASVSCPADGTCTAVGNYITNGSRILTLAERFDGSTWSIETTPNPGQGTNSLFLGVSCPRPMACIAVGYSVGGSTVRGLVEAWNGTTWRIVPIHPPANTFWVTLVSVSCTAPDACMTTGGQIKNGVDSQEQPLAESWDGTAWTIQPTPNPHAENGSALSAMACLSTTDCEAVGIYDYADVNQSVFAWGWSGTSWVRQQHPDPSGAGFNADNAVSCSGAAACTSAGQWTDLGGNIRGLVERWDGTVWTHQVVPDPTGSVNTNLYGVSCSTRSACTAVGDWADNLNGFPNSTLAEYWDGTSWHVQSTPNPAGGTINSLIGVDCTSPVSCVAVGSSYAGGPTTTLVEGYSG